MENMKAMAPPMPFTEPTDSEIKAGFSKWPEQTSTSPSGRHLGHYKALFAPLHRATSPPDPKASPTQQDLFHFVCSMLRIVRRVGRCPDSWKKLYNILRLKKPGDFIN